MGVSPGFACVRVIPLIAAGSSALCLAAGIWPAGASGQMIKHGI